MSDFNKIKNNKKIIIAVIFIVIIAGFLFNTKFVIAADLIRAGSNVVLGTVGSAVMMVLSVIAYIITAVIGLLISLIVALLIQVAQFNNIINVPTVVNGWVIIRDLCNMFFILILLVIAFATILRVESYNYKKILPKLLIMAVLINFSRTIFGLLIDFSQVIMLTFVNAFSTGGGWFMDAFRVNLWYSIKQAATTGDVDVTTWSTSISIIAGVIAAIITLIIVSVMLAVLVMRIIMLWIYTIFSPLVFMGFAVPALQKYTGKIWEDFTKQLVVGPVLAFFIWLALTTASSSSGLMSQSLVSGSGVAEVCVGIGSFFCQGNFQQFLIVIGLLFGGLMIAQQMGGAAGSIAGKGLDWAKKVGAAPLVAGGWAAKGLTFKAGRMMDEWQMKAQKGLGVEFPKSMNYRMVAAGWKADRDKKMADYESGVLTKTGPLHTMWRETFNKHLEIKQYGTVRKSKTQLADEAKEKGKLDFENSILEKRLEFGALSDYDRREEIKKWQTGDGKKLRINAYKEKGYDDKKIENEIAEDEAYLFNKNEDVAGVKEKIGTNNKIIEEYNDPRRKWARKIMPLSAEKATPYEYILSKAGDAEREEKEKKAMESRTKQRAFAVNAELIKAFSEKDNDKLVSAIKILTQNNDLNEGLKDKRIIDIMTRENGILEKMARKGTLGDMGKGEEFNKNLDILKKDFAANPVTPANAQAMVRGMLEEVGVSEKKAARISNDIGEVSFTAGNGLLFGSALGDTDTGDFEFEKLGFKNGRLQTSTTKKAAIAGKYTNVETQAKMRMLHPDIFISERPDGTASGLTEDGRYFLENSLHGNDLTQMNRLRSDVVKKIANSPQTLKDIKDLVDKLSKGTEAQRQQAKHIKYFTGYILRKVRIGEDKDQEKIENAYDEFIG